MTWSNLKMMLRMVMDTRDQELTCDECLEQVDRFVEMRLAGKKPSEALPLVQAHLENCWECREEFEALLEIIGKQNST